MSLKIPFYLCCLTVLLFGCFSPSSIPAKAGNDTFQAEIIAKKKLQEGRNDVELIITNSSGEAVEGAEVEMIPWMPAMNHGVMWLPKITDKGKGKYEVMFILSMGGNWELRTNIKKDNDEDSLVFDIPNVQEGEKKKH